ncbi:MAG: hypothetical protein IJE25_05875 [Clostridia bacterium]|nr:hypothetical protein [Clostridia bacterium]
MLKHTGSFISGIVRSVKIFLGFLSLISQLTIVAYLIYASCADMGYLAVNIILCIAYAAYFGFYIYYAITLNKRTGRERRHQKRTRRRLRLAVKAATLLTTVYGIFISRGASSPLAFIFISASLSFWVFLVIVELIYSFLIGKAERLADSIKSDFAERRGASSQKKRGAQDIEDVEFCDVSDKPREADAFASGKKG